MLKIFHLEQVIVVDHIFLTKVSSRSELKDERFLQLRSNERLECIVAPSILYIVFSIYSISKAFFLK